MSLARIAVIGAGQFGRHHLRVVRQSAGAELAGVADADSERAGQAAQEFECSILSLDTIASNADAAIIAVPTTQHAEVACRLLEAGLDVLVEKPISSTTTEARQILATAERRGRLVQVGHLERFNPAVRAAFNVVRKPLFFEIHRLSPFAPRSLDVDVVLDLMIHDLDILLAMTGAMPQEVRAAGINVLSHKADIANVRLAFPGGCIANLTASRVSTERVRKLRVFQPRQYVSIDYSRQDLLVIAVDENHRIQLRPQAVTKGEPLQLQFEGFLDAIRQRSQPVVDGAAGLRALEAAEGILAKIEEHAGVVARWLESN